MASCYLVDSPAVAISSTAKSVLVVTAGSTGQFKVTNLGIGCDGASAATLKAELLVGTLTGGTTGTAPNVARMNLEAYGRAPIATASLYTAEPTYTKHASNGALAIWTREFVLPMTEFEIEFPLGREPSCPASNVMALRLTVSTGTPNAYASLGIEEG